MKKTNLILKKRKIISDNVYPFVISGVEANIDIDYYEDFKAAELYIKTKKIK